MIEPYSSLQTVFIGGLAAILVMTVATPFIRLKPKFRNSRWLLTGTHVLAWVVSAITLIVSVLTSKPGDAGMLGFVLFLWFVLGTILLGVAETCSKEADTYLRNYGRCNYDQRETGAGWAYYLWSIGGLVALAVGMSAVSVSTVTKSSPPSSIEYSTAADGSKTPVGTEKYLLEKSESGQWVTTALGDRAFSKEQRTVYTWTEKRKSDASDTLTVTKHVTTTIDDNDISVVNDVKPDETPWVEYTPVYYLAPVGIFNEARPNPETDKLCVLGRDTGCKANAKPSHNKIVLHLPETDK
jgi:hypothetical protein